MARARRLASISAKMLGIFYPFLIFFIWRKVGLPAGRRGPPSLLLYWPALVSMFFLFSFGRTLWFPPPFVERLARLQNPHLPADEVMYCRRVTQLWCVFFILNGSISLMLAMKRSIKAWTLYSGCIAYLLVGALFALEYLYRHWRFRRKGAR